MTFTFQLNTQGSPHQSEFLSSHHFMFGKDILSFLVIFPTYLTMHCAKCFFSPNLNPVTSIALHYFLTGRHFELTAISRWQPLLAGSSFWLAATFGLQKHLAGSCVWLAATFAWQPLLAGSPFWQQLLACTYNFLVVALWWQPLFGW